MFTIWFFLSIAVFMTMIFLTTLVVTQHKRYLKEKEIEALKLKRANYEAEQEKLF